MIVRSLAANQTQIEIATSFGFDQVFVSYETPVAAMIDGELYRTDRKWSKTTTRHINKWLAGRNAENKPQSFFDSLLQSEVE